MGLMSFRYNHDSVAIVPFQLGEGGSYKVRRSRGLTFTLHLYQGSPVALPLPTLSSVADIMLRNSAQINVYST